MTFYAAAVAPDATQVFGAYYSETWSGIAALDREGRVTRIKPFDTPDNDSIWSAAFDGRWLAWTERHSAGTLGASDLYVWDSVRGGVSKLDSDNGASVIGPIASKGRLVWSEAREDVPGPQSIHFYSLLDQEDHMVANDPPRAPILFDRDSVLFRESIAGGSQIRMLDFSTGELAPISEPFASIASSSVVQSANLTAWVSGSSVYVSTAGQQGEIEVFRSLPDLVTGPLGVAGDIVSWQVQRGGYSWPRVADLGSGSTATLTRGSFLFTDDRAIVIVISEEQVTKSERAHPDTALLNVNELPPLPRCAS